MSRPLEARAVARLTDVFGVAGSRGRTVGSWLDLSRSMGLAATARRVRGRGGGVVDPSVRNAVYTQIWRDAAETVGAELREIGSGFLEVSRGGHAARLWQQVSPLDDPVTLRLALDKPVVHEMLTKAGVPVPEHVEWNFSDPAPALAFIERVAGPTVVGKRPAARAAERAPRRASTRRRASCVRGSRRAASAAGC